MSQISDPHLRPTQSKTSHSCELAGEASFQRRLEQENTLLPEMPVMPLLNGGSPKIVPESQSDKINGKLLLPCSHDGLKRTPPEQERQWIGQMLGNDGRYEVLELLGRGGMGKVFLAADRNRNGAHVAIKAPLQRLLSVPGLCERFEREFTAMIELEHPHVCRVLDTGSHEGIPFVVLQNLSGGHLGEKFLQSPLNVAPRTVKNLLAWLRPIVQAVSYVHSRDFIHRDIKPENILFDEHGTPYLGDFGIVRAVDEERTATVDSGLTQNGVCVGTPGYMAPEVGTGKPIDGRVDLYALAGVVYLFLTGQSPFKGETPEQLRLAQLTQPVTPVHAINSAIPVAVSVVLSKALSVNPADRQETCGDFVADLEDAFGANAEPIRGGWSRNTRPRDRRFLSRNMLLGSAAIVLMAVALWFESRGHIPPIPPQPPVADQHQRNAETYLADGEPIPALQELNKALELDESRPDFYAKRGAALSAQGEFAAAIEQFTQAITRDPQADFYSERGQAQLALGASDLARADFDEAIKRDAQNPRHQAYRALAYIALKDFERAIRDYSAALEQRTTVSEGDVAGWLAGRGAAYLRLDRFSEALQDSTEAIRLQPREPRHFRNRAIVNQRLGNTTEENRDLREAKRLEAGG